MATVAVVGYSCPNCKITYTRFVTAEEGLVFLIPDGWCVSCAVPVRMDTTVKAKITSEQLDLARQTVKSNMAIEEALNIS